MLLLNHMKAVIYQKYGKAEVLEISELSMPTPKKGEVQIQVKALSLNPRDTNIRKGDFKIITGKNFPKLTGADFSGVVTELGQGVTDFKVGDKVFGYVEDVKKGVSAAYVSLPTKYLCLKPVAISHHQAAALGCTYLTALQAIRNKGKAKAGNKIIIYGASGGAGTAAIQLSKYFGMQVTAVSSAKNKQYCIAQGAEQFLPYDKTDVFKVAEKYDIFFQVYSKDGLLYKQAKQVLKPTGIFICLIPNPLFIFRKWFSTPKFESFSL